MISRNIFLLYQIPWILLVVRAFFIMRNKDRLLIAKDRIINQLENSNHNLYNNYEKLKDFIDERNIQ